MVAKLTLVLVETDGDDRFVPSNEGVSEFWRVPGFGKLNVELVLTVRRDVKDCRG